ncbi:MAG: hypothetical protein ACXWHB_15755 [Usitatibacter sp.]
MPHDMRDVMRADVLADGDPEAFRAFEPFPRYEGEFGFTNPALWLAEKIRGFMPTRGSRKETRPR